MLLSCYCCVSSCHCRMLLFCDVVRLSCLCVYLRGCYFCCLALMLYSCLLVQCLLFCCVFGLFDVVLLGLLCMVCVALMLSCGFWFVLFYVVFHVLFVFDVLVVVAWCVVILRLLILLCLFLFACFVCFCLLVVVRYVLCCIDVVLLFVNMYSSCYRVFCCIVCCCRAVVVCYIVCVALCFFVLLFVLIAFGFGGGSLWCVLCWCCLALLLVCIVILLRLFDALLFVVLLLLRIELSCVVCCFFLCVCLFAFVVVFGGCSLCVGLFWFRVAYLYLVSSLCFFSDALVLWSSCCCGVYCHCSYVVCVFDCFACLLYVGVVFVWYDLWWCCIVFCVCICFAI